MLQGTNNKVVEKYTLKAWTIRLLRSRSSLDNAKSTVLEFRKRSISLRNFASLTGNPPNSDMIDPDSSPTSLTKTLPNKSKVSLQRPSKMSCGTEAKRVLGLVDVSIVTSLPLPASVDTTRTSGALKKKKKFENEIRNSKLGIRGSKSEFVWN